MAFINDLFILMSGASFGVMAAFFIECGRGENAMTINFTNIPVYGLAIIASTVIAGIVKFCYDEHKAAVKREAEKNTSVHIKENTDNIANTANALEKKTEKIHDRAIEIKDILTSKVIPDIKKLDMLDNVDRFVTESRVLRTAAGEGRGPDVMQIISSIQAMAERTFEAQLQARETE